MADNSPRQADNQSREVDLLDERVFETLAEAGRTFDAERDAIEYWTKEEDGMEDERPNDISVKITADVSEAITGFKALQREIRETTKALREYEAAVEGVPFHFDKDGNLTIVDAEITIDGKAVEKTIEPSVNEAQARKESIKRRF